MTRTSFVIFPSSLGKKLITFQVLQHCSAYCFWLQLFCVLLRFLRKPSIHALVGIRNKQLNKNKKVYLNSCVELTFILLSESWIRMLPSLFSIALVMSVQVMKGCTCIIYTEVARILNLFCVIWKHYQHLQNFCAFFVLPTSLGYLTFFHGSLYGGGVPSHWHSV